jgi:hypothetical protein
MPSTAIPTITLAPPPGLASYKAPPQIDTPIIAPIICAMIIVFSFFMTLWFHNTKKPVFMQDGPGPVGDEEAEPHDVEHAHSVRAQDPSIHEAAVQSGPQYVASTARPDPANLPQRSGTNKVSDWSHSIGTIYHPNQQMEMQMQGNGSHGLRPSSSVSWSNGPPTSRLECSANPPFPPILHSTSPPPLPLNFDPRAMPAGQRDTMYTDITEATTQVWSEPSTFNLGSEYDGSVMEGLGPGRPLTEDYTKIVGRAR